MTRPGTRLHDLARRLFDPRTMERLIDPAIADLQHEHDAAMRRGLIWRSRWVRVTGYAAVAKVAALAGLDHALHGRSRDDRTVGRTIVFSLIAIVVLTAVLLWPPLHDMRRPAAVTMAWRFLCLLPQALAVTLPLGLMFGILLALRNRALSRHVRRTVAVLASGCSVAAFVVVGWVLPASNQAFRESMAGMPVPRGLNELTISELAVRDAPPAAGAPGSTPRRLAFEFHLRLALAAAPLTLGLFSIGVIARRRRVYGPVPVALAASMWALGYYTLMVDARSAVYQGHWLPPAAAAWAPNLVIVAMTLALFRGVSRRSESTGTALEGEHHLQVSSSSDDLTDEPMDRC